MENGKVIKIKTFVRGSGRRSWYRRNLHSYHLLIVNFNGEKIRSFYFAENEYVHMNYLFNKKTKKQKYKVGDEIDVIIYKDRKFVKLYYMK